MAYLFLIVYIFCAAKVNIKQLLQECVFYQNITLLQLYNLNAFQLSQSYASKTKSTKTKWLFHQNYHQKPYCTLVTKLSSISVSPMDMSPGALGFLFTWCLSVIFMLPTAADAVCQKLRKPTGFPLLSTSL